MDRKALYGAALATLGLVSMLSGAPAGMAADMPESWHPGAVQRAVPVEDVCAGSSRMGLFKHFAWLRAHPECAHRNTGAPLPGPEAKSSDATRPARPVEVVDPPAPVVPPLVQCNCAIPPPGVLDQLPPIPDFG